jgi:hypothetical protein
MRTWIPTASALAVLLAALAGCGSSTPTGTSADPAGATPGSAAVYVGAVVRPSGALKSDALAMGQRLTRQSAPYNRLLGVLQTPGSPTLDYSHDVAPWLGANAGLFLTSLGSSEALTNLLLQGLAGSSTAMAWPFGGTQATGTATGGGGAQGAIVLDTTDLSAAKTFVANAAAHAGAHASSYRGVAYQATAAVDAFAVIDRLVVLGTESGVHAVIETTQGGPSLKSDATYSHLQSVAPSNALGHVFANPAALGAAHTSAEAHTGAHAGATASGLPELLNVLGGERPLNVSLVPSSDSLGLDADVAPAAARATGSQSSDGGLVAAAAAGNRAFGELPGESWLAAGFGNVEGSIGGGLGAIHGLLSLLNTLGASGAGEGVNAQATFSVNGLLEGLLVPLNALDANTAQAKRDYLSWMGDAGLFASGTSILELKAGVVIDSTNPTASRAAVAKLASALNHAGEEATPTSVSGAEAAVEAKINGLPITLVIADGRSSVGQPRFVIGVGASSVQDALNPSSTMAGTSAYSAAQSALGEGLKPSITASFATLVSLLESVGLSEGPAISKFVPYLRASSTLSGGGTNLSGGVQRMRFVLGLQPSPSSSSG